MVESSRLFAAYQSACEDLLDQREVSGHWIGELSTSALSTATAVSALALVNHRGASEPPAVSENVRLDDLIVGGIRWLTRRQNDDGGWGDTPLSYSNISTTMLTVAAIHLARVPSEHEELLARAQAYIDSQGGVTGLRERYGKDKTFAVPILANCAMAGLTPWREVSALPFELACVPRKFYRFARLPVVSYAIPALVAIGQARHYHRRPFNPLLAALRDSCVEPSLRVLRRIQPASGGYLEAVPLTSFVVMSLADIGLANHDVARAGVEFLVASVREDGSWPIDTNLATWNTTLALNALAQGPLESGPIESRPIETGPFELSVPASDEPARDVLGPTGSGGHSRIADHACLNWLLDCQNLEPHPFTGADPGGWGWSDLSGAVPDADDTPGALLALRAWYIVAPTVEEETSAEDVRRRIERAALRGCRWLLDLQNRNGGWPTFCRGWGKLPFDRSGSDLTAHALRALDAWRDLAPTSGRSGLDSRWKNAIERGWAYLERTQGADGSWVPLWFGNQDQPGEQNPVYGTSKVLLAYRDLDKTETSAARRGCQWLAAARNRDGGWGGGPAGSSVEETALATESLLTAGMPEAADSGVQWLVEAVESGRHHETSPIGFYFAKLWYYEKLYPLTFTVSALGQAVRKLVPPPATASAVASRPRAPTG